MYERIWELSNCHSEQLYWHIMDLLTKLNYSKEVEVLVEDFWSKCIREKWFAGVICRTLKSHGLWLESFRGDLCGGWVLGGGLYPADCSPLTPGSVGKRVQGTGVTRDINTDDSSRPERTPVLLCTSDISQGSFTKPLFLQRDGEENWTDPFLYRIITLRIHCFSTHLNN